MNFLGKKGETIVAKYLLKKGYKVLEKNYRLPFGEIDIIAKDKNEIVFVEVKSASQKIFSPQEKLSSQKIKKILKVAQAYLLKFYPNFPWRVDLICLIQKDKKAFSLIHFKRAVKGNLK